MSIYKLHSRETSVSSPINSKGLNDLLITTIWEISVRDKKGFCDASVSLGSLDSVGSLKIDLGRELRSRDYIVDFNEYDGNLKVLVRWQKALLQKAA